MQMPEHIVKTAIMLLKPYAKQEITPEAIRELCEAQPAKQDHKTDLMTLAEARAEFGVTNQTLRNWEKRGYFKIVHPHAYSHKAYIARDSIKIDWRSNQQ